MNRGPAVVQKPLLNGTIIDMVGMTLGDNTAIPAIAEVYDLKSVKIRNRASELKAAETQLTNYVTQLGKEMPGTTVVPGVTWNPNGNKIPHPTDASKEIVLTTDYVKHPGLVFYDVVSKPKPQPQPVANPVNIIVPLVVATAAIMALTGGGGARDGILAY